jgi:sulfhydrogenase subunit alpha
MTQTPEQVRRIDVDYLARVEGEGAMHVKVVDGVVEDVEFHIFEPPGSSRRFCGGGATPRPPTSPHASVASAPSPTR